MHVIGGGAMAFSYHRALILLQKKRYVPRLRPLVAGVFIVALVATTAVLWEDYEFIMDHVFGTMTQVSNTDTMKDLFDGMMGGIAVTAFLSRRKK